MLLFDDTTIANDTHQRSKRSAPTCNGPDGKAGGVWKGRFSFVAAESVEAI